MIVIPIYDRINLRDYAFIVNESKLFSINSKLCLKL